MGERIVWRGVRSEELEPKGGWFQRRAGQGGGGFKN